MITNDDFCSLLLDLEDLSVDEMVLMIRPIKIPIGLKLSNDSLLELLALKVAKDIFAVFSQLHKNYNRLKKTFY